MRTRKWYRLAVGTLDEFNYIDTEALNTNQDSERGLTLLEARRSLKLLDVAKEGAFILEETRRIVK